MLDWLIVIVLAVVFTLVLGVGQAAYWGYVARQEAKQAEILRRLGGGPNVDGDYETLFKDREADATAASLGDLGKRMNMALLAADSGLGVSGLVLRMGMASAVGMVSGFFMIGIPGAVIGIGLGYFPYFWVGIQGAQRASKLVEQLPDSLELMSRSLQAGLALNDAFRLVAEEMPMPVSGEFGRVFEEVRFGRDYREAFHKMLDRNPGVFDLRLMVSSVLLQRETGGNLIEILENIAETIRSRFVFQAKVRAMTAEARFSALVLGSLPMGVMFILSWMNPRYLSPLWTDPLGNLLLAACATAYILGVFIMRDMSNVEV